ncbi:MAG: aminopeptidase P family protein [Pseudonocardia sp.]|nr:aminopeptidase P family protein [Pseudonocardia sp.]MBO0876066.1 aminopeptidase P family protein [Pseudonocardia sp.]
MTVTSAARTDVSAGDLAERDRRYARVRGGMADAGLDLLLAFGPGWRRENVRYLADAPLAAASAFVALPAEGEPLAFTTNERDVAAILDRGWVGEARMLDPNNADGCVRWLRERHGAASRVGIAHHELLPSMLLGLLRRALPGAEFVSATGLLDDARLVKSDWELDRMRRSASVCAAGWRAFVEALEPGLPEYRIVAAVETEIKRLGAEDNFMLIASGRDEVRGMTPPSDRPLAEGDMVRTELTPQMDGYWLQICRSAVVGRASDAQRRSFDLFNEAVEAGLGVVHPGVTAHQVAKAQNDVFRLRGLGEYCSSRYTRVRGHGHGLHLDETPIIEGNETVLPENSVFIIHPNTYTPIAGYHVLGDPVRVTADGYEILVPTERKLFETEVDA